MVFVRFVGSVVCDSRTGSLFCGSCNLICSEHMKFIWEQSNAKKNGCFGILVSDATKLI